MGSSMFRRAKTDKPSRWRRRIKRTLAGLAIGMPIGVLALWMAVHRYPALGPWLADTLRSIIGTDAVSRLEEIAYGVEDRWNRFWREDEPPRAHWEVPSAQPPLPPSEASARPTLPPFRPADVGPLFNSLAAKGDGSWVAVPDPHAPQAPIALHKTLLHPDRKRPWAELFVVAVDLRQLEIHPVAGSSEPASVAPGARDYQRPALVPSEARERLVMAFNGGFKTEHGRWGMRVDGVTLVPARAFGCTVAAERDGDLIIDAWENLSERQQSLRWWRQTPPCMALDNKRHGGLWDPDARGWGVALGGDTVIRRSAIGLDADGGVLFVSVSNHTTAQAIADGMLHAGAVDIAQLDVNWSYPRIVVFPPDGADRRKAESLFQGFEVEPDDYLRERAPRDFFYLARRPPDGD
jgi:hypothetical protein